MTSSVKTEWEMLCPKCLLDDGLQVQLTVWATLLADGTGIEGQDHEWTPSSACQCECGWTGTVADTHAAFEACTI